MENLEKLSEKELKEINGGWVFDLFYAIGRGAIIQAVKLVDKDRVTPMWMDKN